MLKSSAVFSKSVVFFILLSNFLFVSIYFLYVKYLVFIPFFGIGLIAPVFTAIFFGFLIGVLFNQNNKQKDLFYALEQQKILKKISLLPHQNFSEQELLNEMICLILNVSFAKPQSKGAILLTNSNNLLILKSQLNMNDSFISSFGSKGVKFDECIYILAGQNKESILTRGEDYGHSTKYYKVEGFGFYSVPIMYENNILGLIIVYLDSHHKPNLTEINFLEAAANVLALVLRKFIVDQNLFINEAELLEKQTLVKGILRATPDPLYLLDLDTSEFIYCNKAMDEVLEKHPSVVVNCKKKGIKYFRDMTHPDDLHAFDQMNSTLRSGENLASLKFRTKALDNNKYRWVEQKVLVYKRNKNMHVEQVLIVSKDAHEKMLAQKNVSELHNKLTNQNKEIKKVNAELDQFVYSVSHDLRAPLLSILGLVNLSKYESSIDELKDYIQRIGLNIEKLDGFIIDILNYSRNMRSEIEAEPIILEKLFIGLIDDIKLINNPDIELDFASDEKEPFVGDRRRIAIILNNIISNAIKYADYNKEKRVLKARIKTTIDYCAFTIEDNGIGIRKENLDKVFDMFYRATEKSEGSGLGLYIVKETIDKMHGTIKISSEANIGTSIIIQLPNKTIRTNKV